MASAPNFTTLDEYMNTSYSPDCEYIDGAVLERNVGRGKHGYTQLRLGMKLTEQTQPKNLFVTVEQRTRVSSTRVRIPDVCVIEQLEEVVTTPPLLCVEVLSPEDRWSRVIAIVSDYQLMGVPCIWVIDPYRVKAWIFESENGPVEVQDGRLRCEQLGVEISLTDVLP